MSKITSKIAVPIILAGTFAITVFIAMYYEKLNFSFYIILILLAFYIFFFGFATGQNFASPIKTLLEKANDLSRGNFSSRVYLETKDELSELAKVINEIAEKLEASRIQGESAEKSVDIKVKARTQELEETITALEQKVRNRTMELGKKIEESESMQAEIEKLKKEVVSLKPKLKNLKSRIKRNYA